MIYEPMNEKILVQEEDITEKSESRLILPNDNKAHSYFRVIAVGPGMTTQTGERVKPTLVQGDLILMLERSGVPLRIGDKSFKVTSEREILCKVIE